MKVACPLSFGVPLSVAVTVTVYGEPWAAELAIVPTIFPPLTDSPGGSPTAVHVSELAGRSGSFADSVTDTVSPTLLVRLPGEVTTGGRLDSSTLIWTLLTAVRPPLSFASTLTT